MTRQPTPPTAPEEWRDCPGFPGYQVSTWGNVRSLDRTITTRRGQIRQLKGRALGTYPNPNGYMIATLNIGGLSWTKLVHVLVARAFIGEPPCDDAQVHHKNRNRKDNRLENLIYKAGAQHLSDHFTGEDNPAAKLTECLVDEIKRLIRQGISQRQIARAMNVNQSNISRLNAGITWKHIYTPPDNSRQLNLFLEFELTQLAELEF